MFLNIFYSLFSLYFFLDLIRNAQISHPYIIYQKYFRHKLFKNVSNKQPYLNIQMQELYHLLCQRSLRRLLLQVLQGSLTKIEGTN